MASLTEPYELTFDRRPFYLHAFIKSDAMSVDISLRYLREIADKCITLRYTRLMIERSIPQTLSESELETVAIEFILMGMADIKVAFLDKRAENLEPLRSAMIARNSRGAWADVFTNIDEAERWLLG